MFKTNHLSSLFFARVVSKKIAIILLLSGFMSCQDDEAIDPELVTNPVSAIGTTEAVLNAELLDEGVLSNLAHGFIWSTEPNPNINAENKVVIGTISDPREFSVKIENLLPDVQYYVRSFVSKSDFSAIFYGQTLSFTTLSTSDQVTTSEASSISSSGATLHGKIVDFGSFSSAQHGFVWSTTPGVDILNGTQILLGETMDLGDFSAEVSALNNGSTYYFRAFISNTQGTSIVYGGEQSFSTLN